MNEVVKYEAKKQVIPFEPAWKEAQIYAASGMVNKDFQSPEACYVALRMSEQMGVDLYRSQIRNCHDK
jgi:hypothetical protein